MKRVLSIAVMMIAFVASSFSQVEVAYYDFYAAYDASGRNISSGSDEYKLMVTIADLGFGTTLQASTQSKLRGDVGSSISMPWIPLVPINQMMQYVGTSNGWHVFNWMSVTVYISSDGQTARVERRGFNNKYLGFSEYRKE